MILLLLLAGVTAVPQAAPAPALAARPAFDASATLDAKALDKATAREDLQQVASADQASRVSNNTINGPSTTGTVAIDGNAFQNLQGLSIINSNSGNNVSINAALNVNVQFNPPQ